MFEEILKGRKKKVMFTYERKRFQKSEKVSAKAQTPVCLASSRKAKRPIGMDQSEQGMEE